MKRKSWASRLMVYGLIIGVALLFVSGCATNGVNNPSVQKAQAIPAPYVPTGFPQVVVVSGTDYEMGVQYGRQAASAIYHNVAIFKSKLYSVHKKETVAKDMEVWNSYLLNHDPTLKDWLDGIRQGCKEMGMEVSYQDLVLIMVYPTELWSRPGEYPPEWGAGPKKEKVSSVAVPAHTYHSCNSFAAKGAATPDGNPIHAITQMAGTEMMDNIILIAIPQNGHSFVSQTYAGRVNANNAMNSAGLAWTMTAILSDKPVWGLTEVYFHYLAQIAGSPKEALKYLKDTPRGGVAGGFMLSDKEGIQVFESYADVFSQRTPNEAGFVVQTNHLVDPKLKEYNPPWLQHIGTYQRYDTVYQYLREADKGSVDFQFAKSVLSSDDWYDAKEKTWHANEPGSPFTSNNHTSVSQSIYFPADLTAYLCTGTPSGNGIPAFATGEYVKIKLAENPKKIAAQADADALAYYWEAADLFQHEKNGGGAYLTPALKEAVQDQLDEAMTAYSFGIDRAAYADLEKNKEKAIALWGAALTYFAKAQLAAQMAQATLVEANAR